MLEKSFKNRKIQNFTYLFFQMKMTKFSFKMLKNDLKSKNSTFQKSFQKTKPLPH
jgi:hypothetical protein